MEDPLQGMERKPRPILLKGCLVGCEEMPFLLKGSLVGCNELFRMAFRPGVVGLKRDRALYLFVVAEMEVRTSEEALRA